MRGDYLRPLCGPDCDVRLFRPAYPNRTFVANYRSSVLLDKWTKSDMLLANCVKLSDVP